MIRERENISLVFENGVFSENESNTRALLKNGITFTMSDKGFVLTVPKNKVISAPLHLHYINSQHALTTILENTVFVDEQSELHIIEEYRAKDAENYSASINTQIHAERSARVHYYKIQDEHTTAAHSAKTTIQQKQDSNVQAFFLLQGSKQGKDSVNVQLQARGAECYLHGLYMLNQDGQHVDHHIQVDHIASHTVSSMRCKSILDKKSRAGFTGKVLVHKDAQRINAHQENHNLLLSAHAQVETKPELEIYADDVKCTHGATVGQLNKEALFYLCSRGIPQSEAMKLLTHAFVADVVEHIPLPAVMKYINSLVQAKLTAGGA